MTFEKKFIRGIKIKKRGDMGVSLVFSVKLNQDRFFDFIRAFYEKYKD